MKTLSLTEEQYKFLFLLLDRELRSNGLGSLAAVVDLHNMLLMAANTKEADEKPETDTDQPD
jgi:hypothetical protein